MQAYYSVLIGHVDAHKRPAEIPAIIRQEFVDEVNNPFELMQIVAARLKQIVDNGGMVTIPLTLEGQKPPNRTKRVWVPMHMFTHFESDVRVVSGIIKQLEDGSFTDEQGKKVTTS